MMLRIEVTQEDIDKALALPVFDGDWAANCPVAQALIRTGHTDVSVPPFAVFADGKRYDFKWGEGDFGWYISNIDHAHRNKPHKPVEPAIFILEETP